LKEKRSPDEISGRMQVEGQPFYASREAIYKWLYGVWGQKYCKHLCTKRYDRRPYTKRRGKRVMIPDRTPLVKRPLGATNKSRYGHWEDDTVVSPKFISLAYLLVYV